MVGGVMSVGAQGHWLIYRNPRERQVLAWYSNQWRQLRGGACDMGRPEAQIVSSLILTLLSKGEVDG
jgi:hypothetical protein